MVKVCLDWVESNDTDCAITWLVGKMSSLNNSGCTVWARFRVAIWNMLGVKKVFPIPNVGLSFKKSSTRANLWMSWNKSEQCGLLGKRLIKIFLTFHTHCSASPTLECLVPSAIMTVTPLLCKILDSPLLKIFLRVGEMDFNVMFTLSPSFGIRGVWL